MDRLMYLVMDCCDHSFGMDECDSHVSILHFDWTNVIHMLRSGIPIGRM